jgi:hypothetical protein
LIKLIKRVEQQLPDYIMKKKISFLVIPVFLIFSQHAVYSQTIDNFEPVQDSRTVMDISGQAILTGMYIDIYGIGADLVYRPEYRPYYGHMFAGSMWDPSRRITDARQIYTAGVTIGREWILNRPEPDVEIESEGSILYARIGPGIGFSGISRIDNGSMNIYPGIHTTASFGGMRHLMPGGTFFVETRLVIGFYPGLNEMQVIGGPQLSVGIAFLR